MAVTKEIHNDLAYNIGSGKLATAVIDFTMSAEYPSGGEPFAPTADLTYDFGTVLAVNCEPKTSIGAIYVHMWEHTTKKIIAYEESGDEGLLTLEGAGGDLSAHIVRVTVVGTRN